MTYTDDIKDGFTRLGTEVKGKLSRSLLTTKGDLIVGGTAGAPQRLGVGADGQVLTADTASAGGSKWAAAAAGGGGASLDQHGGAFVPGYWYANGSASTNYVGVAPGCYLVPMSIAAVLTLDSVAFGLYSSSASSCDLAFYTLAGNTATRTSAVTTGVSLASATGPNVVTANMTGTLTPGTQWLAVRVSNYPTMKCISIPRFGLFPTGNNTASYGGDSMMLSATNGASSLGTTLTVDGSNTVQQIAFNVRAA